MEGRVPITPQGYKSLQGELKRLKSVERPKAIQAIEEARAHGDLSENAEYDAAKEHQAQLDQRMRECEDRLSRAQIIRPEDVKGDRVVFGATVVLTDFTNDKTVKYQVVGETEANLKEGKISVISPLARSMIGKALGDAFVVNTPAGEREYMIEDIKFV